MTESALPRSRWRRIARYRLLLALATGVFAVDRLTKAWVVDRLAYNDVHGPLGHIPVIPGFFKFVYVGNTGAAWSLFDGHGDWLAGLALLTLAAIFWFRRALGLEWRIVQLAFGLICGGAIGNLYDRVVHKHVIDFLDFTFGTYHYPTFNVADSCIVCGVVLYIWLSFRPLHGAGR